MSKILTKFKTKSGKEIEIYEPSLERLPELLEFVNRLVAEDTFLSFVGKSKTLAEEERWLKMNLDNIKTDKTFLIWAVYDGKIIGQCDIEHGKAGARDWHVGNVGLMVDRDFRQDGIGKFLLNFVLTKAKKMNIQIVSLTVFGDNDIAIKLYQKFGFKEWGRLPKGLYRKNKYSDAVKMYKELL